MTIYLYTHLCTCLQRFRAWFKNHSRPSKPQGSRTRGFFSTKRESKKLSDQQIFSKLYYALYKEPIKKKWRQTYITFYKEAIDDLPDTTIDAVKCVELDKDVHELIRNCLKDGSISTDILPEDVEAHQNQAGGEDNEDDGPDAGEDGTRVPKVPVWYCNAIMKDLLENASPLERDAIEDFRRTPEEDGEGAADESIEEQKVKRLRDIIRYDFACYNPSQFFTSHDASHNRLDSAKSWNIP